MYPLIRRYLRRVDVFYLLLCAACSALSVVVLLSIGQTQLGSNNKASVQLIASLLGMMPAPVTYAHRLVQRQAEVRKNGTLPWLRPDAKSQVTFQYDDGKIVGIDAVVLSTQHAEDIDQKSLQEAVMEEIIKPILPTEWLNASTKFFINPTGRFVIGGPMGDCGLTGRKIIVDTYGGMARHGGGAFSGKFLYY